MSCSRRWRASLLSLILAVFVCRSNGNELIAVAGDDLRSDEVRASIARGVAFLQSQQAEDGTFHSSFSPAVRLQSRVTRTTNGRPVVKGVRVVLRAPLRVGPTALAMLALLNAGLSVQDPCVARALEYLREVHDPAKLSPTYDSSLLLMALVAAREWDKDRPRIAALAKQLEAVQTTRGAERGMWSYGDVAMGGDNSNTPFSACTMRPWPAPTSSARLGKWRSNISFAIRTPTAGGAT
jgi:hypothetical protein